MDIESNFGKDLEKRVESINLSSINNASIQVYKNLVLSKGLKIVRGHTA